jgi:hypothetical protein
MATRLLYIVPIAVTTDRAEASMKIDKILVPLDGSTLAEMLIPKAIDLATTPREAIHV